MSALQAHCGNPTVAGGRATGSHDVSVGWLEVLRPEFGDCEERVAAFLDEAHWLAALSNEHIVRILDAGRLPRRGESPGGQLGRERLHHTFQAVASARGAASFT